VLHGNVLDWFRSYLSGRTFYVVFGGSKSRTVYIFCSVPQGSVLGLLLFIVYMADIVDQHGVFLHAFADDTQMYLHCHRDDLQSAAAQLELCISDVGQWMAANRLKLNTDKTELIWTGSKASLLRQSRCLPALQLGHDSIAASDHVRLLGATISFDLSLDRHVVNVSALPASIGCSSFDASGAHWTWTRPQHWSTHSYRRVSTTATFCWQVRQKWPLTGCNG